MYLPKFSGGAVMPRQAWTRMLGIEDRVGNQLAHMVVLEAIEHGGAFTTGSHQSSHPQFRQVLRHRRCGLSDTLRQFVHRAFSIDQRPQNLHPRRVSEHPEHLDDEIHLIIGKLPPTNLTICVHA